jgi:hypothetical protein
MYRAAGYFQIGVRIRYFLTQDMQSLAQVGQRLGFRRVGPKFKGQMLAAMVLTSVYHEISQQRLVAGYIQGYWL